MVAVTNGQRPPRPSRGNGITHGLNKLWTLIEACWATHPANRLTARLIVEAIISWPEHSVDQRAPQQWDDESTAIIAEFEEVASTLSQAHLPALEDSDPAQWQNINMDQIISTIHDLTELSRSDALECANIIRDVGVYQVWRFVILFINVIIYHIIVLASFGVYFRTCSTLRYR
jgi:hypothetical protein